MSWTDGLWSALTCVDSMFSSWPKEHEVDELELGLWQLGGLRIQLPASLEGRGRASVQSVVSGR